MIIDSLYIKFDNWEESNLAMEKLFSDRSVKSVTLIGIDAGNVSDQCPTYRGRNRITGTFTLDGCQGMLASKKGFWWQFFQRFHSDDEKDDEEIITDIGKPMRSLKIIRGPLVTRAERDRMDVLEDKLAVLAEKIDALESKLK